MLQEEALHRILFSPCVSLTVQGRHEVVQSNSQWIGKGSPTSSKEQEIILAYKMFPTNWGGLVRYMCVKPVKCKKARASLKELSTETELLKCVLRFQVSEMLSKNTVH